MKILKNERAYMRWATGRDGFASHDPQRARQYKPTTYPCVVYTIVSDWGVQEEQPVYLRPDDVRNILAGLEKIIKGGAR
jgi:hypothetical protein